MQSKYTRLDCRCYGQHSHKNKSRAEIRREPFIRAVFVLDYTCSYKWYSLRLIFPCINGLSVWIHVHCMWLAKSINRRVKDMAVRGESSPLSGIICATLNSVSQGNFTFVRKKVRNFRNLWLCLATMPWRFEFQQVNL